MTLLVDERVGSAELLGPLQRLGLSAELTRLNAGDIAFEGRGEKGKKLDIGIEFKHLGELVANLRSARLQGHQLPKMKSTYDFSWLVIEGELLYNKRGVLLKRTGPGEFRPLSGHMVVGELLKRVFVLHLCGGLNPLWTRTRRDTLKTIEALYRVWTDEDLDKHKSHIAIYQPPALVPITQFRETIRTLPGVGLKTSLAAQGKFKNIRRAINASFKEWAELVTIDDAGKTRHIGRTDAERIVQEIEREY